MSLSFSKFNIQRAVFEFRYEQALRLWDRSGAIWGALCELWSEMEQDEIKPDSQSFHVGDQFELKVSLGSASIIEHRPKSGLEDFLKAAERFSSVVVNNLNISTYKRLGFRTIYHRKYDSIEYASQAVLGSGMLLLPESPIFNVKAQPSLPEVSVRWEDEKFGVRVMLKAQEEKLKFTPPALHADKLTHQAFESSFVSFDVDYYTAAPVSVDSVRTGEFLSQSYHVVKRDSKKILGE